MKNLSQFKVIWKQVFPKDSERDTYLKLKE